MRNIDYVKLDSKNLDEDESTGFLKVMANLTRTGIFTYFEKSPDGTIKIIRQLRLPEEVFSEASMASLEGLPATNMHPSELVNTANANDYVVGMTSDTPKKVLLPVSNGDESEEYVQQKVTFFDSDTIQEIKDGKKLEMSLGYTCFLDEQAGEWKGQKYDCIQREIRYNHLALVERGRAGPMARVLTDSKDSESELNFVCDGIEFYNEDKKGDMMKVIIVDGKEYKASEELASAVSKMQEGFAELSKNLDAEKSENEKLQAKVDEYGEKLKEVKDEAGKEEFAKAVAARVSLEKKAEKFLGEVKLDGLSDIEVKKEVIKKLRPETKLDDKSDAYVEARFDVAIEDGEKPAPKSVEKLGKSIKKDETLSYEEARKKAFAELKDSWKKPIV